MKSKSTHTNVYAAGYNRLMQKTQPVYNFNKQYDSDSFTVDSYGGYQNAINVDEVIQYTLTISSSGSIYEGTATIPYSAPKVEAPFVFGFVTVGTQPNEHLAFLPYYEAIPQAGIDYFMEINNYSFFQSTKAGIVVKAYSTVGDTLTWDYVFYVLKDKKSG